ncbi:DUF3152 domain-containing protein [Streptomyces sp. NPDC020681]|uniref:DUF3152 domain-containing protein n=1 Tax=Streptomyces sp. NPDC020681 TaxID=3365083 RepID=UPI00379EF310
MGRHSRKGPAPKGSDPGSRPGGYDTGTHDTGEFQTGEFHTGEFGAYDTGQFPSVPSGTGDGRRRHAPGGHAPSGNGAPQARGGHPEQHEAGGGWGVPQQRHDGGPGGTGAQRRQAPPRTVGAGARIPGPRREFIEAFDEPQQARTQPSDPFADPYASVTSWTDEPGQDRDRDAETQQRTEDEQREERPTNSKGRTFTGIAAAAVTTVLAVVVAGQVAADGPDKKASSASNEERSDDGSASRSDNRQAGPPNAAKPAAPAAPAAPVTYAQLMATQFKVDPKLTADGTFEAVPGFDKAPGKGEKIRYRVDVEKGLGLDGALFASAVQKTLNDDRSWAHGGAMTFERISSGEPEFVITLASPGTNHEWCAKSGLDTAVDNVSCDSASTDRVMINAYRWAMGAATYGAKAMFPYRQMLINHEVGHRLGYGHVNCSTPGRLAPVMQQQTKSLDIDGVKCRPNPWVYPGG